MPKILIFCKLQSADEGSSEGQESNSESDDDSGSENEEYVPADAESLDESASEPFSSINIKA